MKKHIHWIHLKSKLTSSDLSSRRKEWMGRKAINEHLNTSLDHLKKYSFNEEESNSCIDAVNLRARCSNFNRITNKEQKYKSKVA